MCATVEGCSSTVGYSVSGAAAGITVATRFSMTSYWATRLTTTKKPPRRKGELGRVFEPGELSHRGSLEGRAPRRQVGFTQRLLQNAVRSARHEPILIAWMDRTQTSGEQPGFRNKLRRLGLTDRHFR